MRLKYEPSEPPRRYKEGKYQDAVDAYTQAILADETQVPNLRTTTSQKCAAVPRRARI